MAAVLSTCACFLRGLVLVGLPLGGLTFGALALGDADFATVLPGFVTRDVVWVRTSSLVLTTLWCLPVVTADPEAVVIVADSVGSALRGLPTCPLATLAAVGDCFFALVVDLCTDLCVLGSLVPVAPAPCFTDLAGDFRSFSPPPLAGLGSVTVGVGGVTSTVGVDDCVSTTRACCSLLVRA